MNEAIVVLGPSGLECAEKIKAALPGAEIQVRGEDFDDTLAQLRALFTAGRPIIGVFAAGIAIRALAPLLADKRTEPPVLAVAEDGSVAVPLLGGHRGANRLAREIAKALDGTAAVTTAGDVSLGVALDEPPAGWTVANPEAAKKVTADLLAGVPVGLTVETGDADWLEQAVPGEDGARGIRVTDARIKERDDDTLVLHPPVLAVGVGCERGTPAVEVAGLVEHTLRQAKLARGAVAAVVSIDVKADETAVHEVARELGVPARFFPAEVLEAETPRLATPSDVVFAEVGCHGVAEGAALAAVGPEGSLIAKKQKTGRATCAVAKLDAGLDATTIGTPQGRLTVVGIGPGTGLWRAPEATRVLREATDVVGYRLYLDLVAEVIAGKTLHHGVMTQEEERVRLALDLAAEGKDVALVSSGDAGIYALAALTFELLDREDRADWNRLAVSVVPGISALQAAASRAGAPLGHDFCTVSLSDLLTPWEEIERKLKAAAEGDFVVALYNPVSKRRRTQLVAAKEILMAARGPDAPVILGRNLGREDETVTFIALSELEPDMADMLTLVMIGNRQTRLIERGVKRWVYTPRGYAKKMDG